eukprot:2250791-Lingulodinium_polyedra.AAC.1
MGRRVRRARATHGWQSRCDVCSGSIPGVHWRRGACNWDVCPACFPTAVRLKAWRPQVRGFRRRA